MNWTRFKWNNRINSRIMIFATIFTTISLGTAMIFAATVVEPARFIFLADRGERVTGTIKVTNSNPKEMNANAVLYDWGLDKDNKMVTYDSGTHKETLKGLIKFNPQSFKLAPGQSQIVRFTLTAPQEGPLFERRGIVFFEEKMLVKDASGKGAIVIAQVGSTIYLSLKGTRMGFRMVNSTVDKVSSGIHQTALEIANQGLGHIRYFVSYKIIDDKGALVHENQLTEKVILPETNQKIFFRLPEKMAEGKYNLLLNVNFFGTDKAYSKTIPFEVEK